MRGQVLGFDNATGQGMISGDDGTRYAFARGDLQGGAKAAMPGGMVDFNVSDGRAVSIYPIASTGLQADKNKIVAGLLGIFLGAFGIHKFYLGKNGAGIIMLVVFFLGFILLGVPSAIISLIGFIEGIIYLVKDEQRFYEQYVVGNRSWF